MGGVDIAEMTDGATRDELDSLEKDVRSEPTFGNAVATLDTMLPPDAGETSEDRTEMTELNEGGVGAPVVDIVETPNAVAIEVNEDSDETGTVVPETVNEGNGKAADVEESKDEPGMVALNGVTTEVSEGRDKVLAVIESSDELRTLGGVTDAEGEKPSVESKSSDEIEVREVLGIVANEPGSVNEAELADRVRELGNVLGASDSGTDGTELGKDGVTDVTELGNALKDSGSATDLRELGSALRVTETELGNELEGNDKVKDPSDELDTEGRSNDIVDDKAANEVEELLDVTAKSVATMDETELESCDKRLELLEAVVAGKTGRDIELPIESGSGSELCGPEDGKAGANDGTAVARIEDICDVWHKDWDDTAGKERVLEETWTPVRSARIVVACDCSAEDKSTRVEDRLIALVPLKAVERMVEAPLGGNDESKLECPVLALKLMLLSTVANILLMILLSALAATVGLELPGIPSIEVEVSIPVREGMLTDTPRVAPVGIATLLIDVDDWLKAVNKDVGRLDKTGLLIIVVGDVDMTGTEVLKETGSPADIVVGVPKLMGTEGNEAELVSNVIDPADTKVLKEPVRGREKVSDESCETPSLGTEPRLVVEVTESPVSTIDEPVLTLGDGLMPLLPLSPSEIIVLSGTETIEEAGVGVLIAIPILSLTPSEVVVLRTGTEMVEESGTGVEIVTPMLPLTPKLTETELLKLVVDMMGVGSRLVVPRPALTDILTPVSIDKDVLGPVVGTVRENGVDMADSRLPLTDSLRLISAEIVAPKLDVGMARDSGVESVVCRLPLIESLRPTPIEIEALRLGVVIVKETGVDINVLKLPLSEPLLPVLDVIETLRVDTGREGEICVEIVVPKLPLIEPPTPISADVETARLDIGVRYGEDIGSPRLALIVSLMLMSILCERPGVLFDSGLRGLLAAVLVASIWVEEIGSVPVKDSLALAGAERTVV